MALKPIFTKSNEEARLFLSLKELVAESIPSEKVDIAQKIKLFLLPSLYISFWILAMYFQSTPVLYFLFFGLMGIVMTLIFVNLIHDACHQSLFNKKWQNQTTLYLFDLLGANSYIWCIRHIRMHHNYPNTQGWDCDVEESGPLKIFPFENGNFLQKNQHLWCFIIYPFFSLNWLLVRDFRDFYSSKRNIRKVCTIPLKEHYKLWLFKFFFVAYTIAIPVLGFKVGVIQSVIGLMIQMILGSLLGMIILLTPHVNIKNEFPVPDDNLMMSTTWLKHQFITTNDINGNNFFTKHLMNNFNFHLAHHLFPKISAKHADTVTQIIKEHAEKHDLPYKSYSLTKAFRLHYHLIRNNALHPFTLFEETL